MHFQLECCSANEWLNLLQTIFGQEPPVSSVQGWCSAPWTFGKQERFLAIAEKHEKVEHLCFWQSCLTFVYLNLISIMASRDKWDVSCLYSFWIHTTCFAALRIIRSVRSAGACRATSVGQRRNLGLGECPNRSDLKNQIIYINLYQFNSIYKFDACHHMSSISSALNARLGCSFARTHLAEIASARLMQMWKCFPHRITSKWLCCHWTLSCRSGMVSWEKPNDILALLGKSLNFTSNLGIKGDKMPKEWNWYPPFTY